MDRMSGSLPMIKCSTCALDIDILQLADHVCATPASSSFASPAPPPAPALSEPISPKLRGPNPNATFSSRYEGLAQPPRGRAPPPRIDSQAANKPFRPQEPSPSSMSDYSNPRGRSPLPSAPPKSPFRSRIGRSPAPPSMSPDLPSNMDSAFPRFPTARTPGTPARGQGPDRLGPNYNQLYAEPSPMFAPLSPRMNGGENITKRMDNIRPGPFDGRRSPTPTAPRSPIQQEVPAFAYQKPAAPEPQPLEIRNANTPPPPQSLQQQQQQQQQLGHRRTETSSSSRSTGSMSKLRTSLKSISSSISRRSGSISSRNRISGPTPSGTALPTTNEQPETADAFRGAVLSTTDEQPEESWPAPPAKTRRERPEGDIFLNGALPPLPPSNEQPEGIDAFLGRLQSEANISRSQQAQSERPGRSMSRDKRQPPPRPRRPSTRDLPPENISELKVSDFFAQSDNRLSSRDPIYPRSESATRRDHERSRSRSPHPLVRPAPSPNGDAPLAPLHTPSDSGLSDESYSSYRSQSIASSRSSPPESEAGHSRQASKLTEENYQRSATPESIESQPLSQQHRRGESVARLKPISLEPIPRVLSPGYASTPESPMDPAIQFGIDFEKRPRQRAPPVQQDVEQSPPRPTTSQDQESRRAPTTKGNCRGCSEPIVGKSIKDSSGRLTGRYHKHCFVCRTCGDGFPTAEFYVFNNSPYCEQHYHELNGSLCKSCNRGIEGQYLETDQRLKYHPRCFACSTCRIPLSADYYEVGGQKFCDRHAPRMQPQQNYLGPGDFRPRNMQKRRTRLMMM